MLVSGGSIYVGSSAITEVYQGADLVWSNGVPAPAWPDNYYYPDLSFMSGGRGLGYWKSHFNSGETATIYFKSDDCEGEGGNKMFTYKSKTTGQTLNIYEDIYNYSITANTACDYLWLMPYSHYEAQNTSLPSFWSGCTALCWRQQEGSCGTSVSIPSGDYSNIELLVCLSPDYSYYDGFANLVKKCPNLKYISNGTLTGSSSQYTITLTGSTAWTADSMKFTEWYCPGTTFIIENNSWWRSRIDWGIAAARNITFKDGNGNIITQ